MSMTSDSPARSTWAGPLPKPQSAHPCSCSSQPADSATGWLTPPQIGRAPLPGWKLPLVNSSLLVLYFSQQLSQEPMAPVRLTSLVGINMPYGKEICMVGGQGGKSFLASVKGK